MARMKPVNRHPWLRASIVLLPLLVSLPRAQVPDAGAGRAAGSQVTRGLLGDGAAWETPFVVVDSMLEGPTLLIVGGMHGNEPAGAMAAEQIAGWRIARGRMVVVPRANVRALAANKRRTPDVAQERSDLNRQFPAEGPPGTDLARALWSLVERSDPDMLIDLHEGYDYHEENPDSVGSTVITDRTEASRALGNSLIEAVNATINAAPKRFSLIGPPVSGSLARAAHDRLGIQAMILETTTKGQAAAFRTRQHRLLVHRLLTRLEMAAHGPDVMVGSAGEDDDVAIAMYVSSGVSGEGPDRLEALLDEDHGFDLRRVCATDVRAGVLEQFDLVVFPGGSGSGQAEALRPEGRESVRSFVAGGGGYLGVCAGAYLASSGYEWSLDILDAVVIDRAHWRRGRGDVELRWTGAGQQRASGGRTDQSILYVNGPLYAPAGDDALPDYEVWAVYASEMNTNGAPEGVMLGTPAIIFGRFERGRVVGVSPHPEQTADCGEIVRSLALRAAGR